MRNSLFMKGAALSLLSLTVIAGNSSADETRADVRASDMPHLMIDRAQPAPYRSDVLEFELAPKQAPGWRLEYKVSARAGDALLYSLTASAPVVSEFHNEMLPRGSVMFYREEAATTAFHGQFISPANGAHGWYLANTTDRPVKIRLQLSGYYTLVPGLIKIKT